MSSIQDAVHEVLVEWADFWIDKTRNSLDRHGHTDSAGSGNLAQSLSLDPETWITENGEGAFLFRLTLPDYYTYTNKGRGPTKNPGNGAVYRSLTGPTGWVSRKGINVRQATGLKDSITANKSLSFMFAAKIHKKGFRGTHWFDEVWGGDPVPANSPALQDLNRRLSKKLGNADFLLSIVDPKK